MAAECECGCGRDAPIATGWTGVDLAGRFGVSQSTISFIKHDVTWAVV